MPQTKVSFSDERSRRKRATLPAFITRGQRSMTQEPYERTVVLKLPPTHWAWLDEACSRTDNPMRSIVSAIVRDLITDSISEEAKTDGPA